jgi:two-component system response regulator
MIGAMDDPLPDIRPIEILLVDDDAGDRLLVNDALEHHKLRNRLTCVTDGVEALRYLHGEGEHTDAARPDLILLDLNLPRMDGRELLERIKGDDELSAIPVVVLTTSASDGDILRSYELHANAYVPKPVDFAGFMEIVRQIEDFYITVARLPGR